MTEIRTIVSKNMYHLNFSGEKSTLHFRMEKHQNWLLQQEQQMVTP